MRIPRRLIFAAFIVGQSLFAAEGASDPNQTAGVSFEQDIAPILEAKCLGCHNPNQLKGDFSMATLEEIQAASEEYVVPGNAADSMLYWITLPLDEGEAPEMPEEGDALTEEETKKLAAWIDAGAEWPEGLVLKEASKADENWWSFQPVSETELDSIDAFIEAELREEGLVMNPESGRRTVIRRVTLDLTGLPPTPEEVETFINDPDPRAYEKLIDSLLASPRYGERWAQHWLDVIRWAETVGFETNIQRPNAWPYRDWVIESLNGDLPYDRFIFEQLAGDTVGEDAALGFLVAGPANLPPQVGRDEAAMRGARQDELDEVVRTVGQAFLGVTIGCARCHDHKFDPILQSDYYSMQAIFAGLAYGERRHRGPENDAWTSDIPRAREQLETTQVELEALRKKYGLRKAIEDVHTDSILPVRAQAIRMRIEATGNGKEASLYEFEVWSTKEGNIESTNVALAEKGAQPSASSFALANQSRHFDNLVDGSIDKRQAFPWVSKETGPAWIRVDFAESATIDRIIWHRGSSIPAAYVIEVLPPDSDKWHEVAHTRDRLLRSDDTRKADAVHFESLDQEETQLIVRKTAALRSAERELARLSAGPRVYAASFTENPEATYLLRRGDSMQRLNEVLPDIPKVLGELAIAADVPEAERRLALANHLTQPNHPLTARVLVNRVWQHHFGTGLVETSSDFGYMGAAPSHPALLDWLAGTFVAEGWSLKKLHRLILSSKTFRQSSSPQTEALSVDADSRLLWRFPPRRLEAEALRDSILSVSGKLNFEMGGQGFDFFNQRGGLSDYLPKETFDESGWRRMIYAHKVRMISVDIFGAFDCPEAGQMKPNRTRSITPVQSLGLLNSPFVNRQAAYFAERLYQEVGDNLDAQIDRAFSLALSRPPSLNERQQLIALAEDHGLEQVCRAIFNTSEFAFLQ
ncbi:MAG: PSD1 and planctomycete cytochrome C domain-containing protein [Verrucomicrobia bacterium]|nr:PSD1 and planctomycete cytochrome C domain-containing protein [Verrucomicrobiota bacterium]MDA1065272.1 PSD1 and planctomycete cytochrome C domain-containing protein [Verrucomicrobiota bacterium]